MSASASAVSEGQHWSPTSAPRFQSRLPTTPSASSQSQKVATLERVVLQQQERLAALEELVQQQAGQLARLEAQVRNGAPPLASPAPAAPALPPTLAAAAFAESALSESMKQLTSQLERKLRESDNNFSPESVGKLASPPPAAERRLRAPPEFSSPPPPVPTGGVGSADSARAPTPPESAQTGRPRPVSAGSKLVMAAPAPSPGPAPQTTATGAADAPKPSKLQQSSISTPASRPSTSSRGASRPGSGSSARPGSGSSRSRPSSARSKPSALEHLATLQGGTEQPVTGVVVSECGSGLVSCGLDGQLQLWSRADDTQQGLGTTSRSALRWRRTLTQPVGGGEINGMALRGSLLACGCQDGSVRLFRLFKEAGAFVLYSLLRKQHTSLPAAAATAAAAANGAAANGGEAPGSPGAAAAPSEVMCVALSTVHSSRHAPLLASGAQDGSVCLWDSSSGRLTQRLEAHKPGGSGWVMALVLARHEDGRSGLMLTASYDHTVKVWVRPADDVGASGVFGGSSRFDTCGASGASGCGAFAGSAFAGSGCVSSSFAGGVGSAGAGWALDRTLTGHEDGVLGLEVSRSRRHAFSGSEDRTVRVWELRSGSCLCVLRAHGSSVAALGWHPSSGCLATGAEDGAVHLWDVSKLEEPTGIQWDAKAPMSITAAGEGDGPCSLVKALTIEHSEVLCIATSADGTALFCGLDDGGFALLGLQEADGLGATRPLSAGLGGSRPPTARAK